MTEPRQPRPPAGLTRWLLHLPVYLYRIRLGFLLGHRFLVLTHSGRKTGRRYHTALEVIRVDKEVGASIVMAGWGHQTEWLHNVEAGLAAEIQTGRARYEPVWRILEPDEARWTLRGYLDRHSASGPIIRRVLGRMLGWSFDASEAAVNRAVEQLPMVGFRPPSVP